MEDVKMKDDELNGEANRAIASQHSGLLKIGVS